VESLSRALSSSSPQPRNALACHAIDIGSRALWLVGYALNTILHDSFFPSSTWFGNKEAWFWSLQLPDMFLTLLSSFSPSSQPQKLPVDLYPCV
jgi:hypothetical protein